MMKPSESQCTNRTKPQNYSFSSDPSTCQGHAAAFNAFSPSVLFNLSLPLRFMSAGVTLCGRPYRSATPPVIARTLSEAEGDVAISSHGYAPHHPYCHPERRAKPGVEGSVLYT